jgi:putative SOS response-associated peptidase YedK
MALAGIWEGWKAETGKVIRSFAIITTTANESMAQIHGRMPVILDPSTWPAWLGEEEGDAADLLKPAGDSLLETWPVSLSVNSPRHNGPELLMRFH